MNIEIHIMAYQFVSGGYLNNTTFLNMKVYNRSTMNYHDFRQTIFMDVDIGGFSDDFVGCDTVQNIAYGYNGDSFDEDDSDCPGYHNYPPCLGIKSLNRKMDYFCHYTNGQVFPYTDPATPTEFWNFMNGKWSDGITWNHNGANITHFFSGSPLDQSQWSEVSEGNPVGDRRLMMTVSEADFPIGSMICTDYAILFDNSSSNSFQNVQNTLNIAQSLQTLYDSSPEFPCAVATANTTELFSEASLHFFPNPTSGTLNIKYNGKGQEIAISLYDLSGRHLWTHKRISTDEIVLNLNEKSGTYILQVNTPEGILSQRLVIE